MSADTVRETVEGGQHAGLLCGEEAGGHGGRKSEVGESQPVDKRQSGGTHCNTQHQAGCVFGIGAARRVAVNMGRDRAVWRAAEPEGAGGEVHCIV